jgi:fructose-1,6-bisphosphatase/inositol monophosphatase family enzyme
MAAGSLIVREARGLISNFQGNPLELKRQNILAGNRSIYKQLKEVVKEALK